MLLGVREPRLDDVVEVLLQSHAFARSMLALADRISTAPADASTAGLARRIADYFQFHLEGHFADEEQTLTPRLAGRHPVLDQAIAAMRLEHLQLHALLSRVGFLCGLVAKDPQRLLTVRFELSAAVEQLRASLESHQAREESILFPAVRRLVDWQDVEEMRHEMALRRAPGLELTDA